MKSYERKSFPRTARDLKVMNEKGNLSFEKIDGFAEYLSNVSE